MNGATAEPWAKINKLPINNKKTMIGNNQSFL